MATHDDFNFTSRSDGGPQNNNGGWSSFMNTYNVGGEGGAFEKTYSWSVRFNNYGRQTFDTAVDDEGDFFINGVYQFSMGGYGGQTSRTTPGYFAPGVYTISANSRNTGGGPWGIALDWTGYTPPPAASISSFTASPNPQNSSNGIPQYNTRLSWATANAASVTITSSAGETFSGLGGSGNLDITNLPQSNADTGNTPSSRNYTLTATNIVGVSTSQTITVEARNDNSPTTSWTTSFSNLNPSTEYQFSLGQLSGVDMSTIASTSGTGNFVGTGQNGFYASSLSFLNNNSVWLKFTSLPFNTDVSGETGIYGKTNSKTIPVTVGTVSFNVTVTTRAPRIAEDFDYANNLNVYPYEDVDLIANSPTEYLNTAIITADDVEIPVEIKTNNPDIQVNINGTGWQNIRSI